MLRVVYRFCWGSFVPAPDFNIKEVLEFITTELEKTSLGVSFPCATSRILAFTHAFFRRMEQSSKRTKA